VDRRGFAFLAVLLLVAFVATALLVGGGSSEGDAVVPPAGIPGDAQQVDGLLTQVTTAQLVVDPEEGDPVELVVTQANTQRLDLPHLINFHQGRDEPVRVFYQRQGAQNVALAAVDLPGGVSESATTP